MIKVSHSSKRMGKRSIKPDISTAFPGMQVQVNVLDRETLIKAKESPELYPNLLVRISGYSAYFNDLTDEMKDEVIERTGNTAVDRH